MVAEGLALVDVGDVHLDDRRLERIQRIEDGDRGVGEGSRIDRKAAGGLARLVDPVDDLVFAVALVEAQLELELIRQLAAVRLDIGQGLVAVDLGLTLAQRFRLGPFKK